MHQRDETMTFCYGLLPVYNVNIIIIYVLTDGVFNEYEFTSMRMLAFIVFNNQKKKKSFSKKYCYDQQVLDIRM